MITLITAVPGSGKTLYTLKTLSELAKREDRQVYYYGIKLTDLGKKLLGWIELEDPLKWFELPPQAIVVIDEFQKVFPKRPNGSPVPKYMSEFETHRHLGIDVWLITQGTKLFDTHLKDLIGKHIHLLRIFGAKAAQVLKWDGCQQNPNSKSVKADCLDSSKFIYPKEVFKWYVSAEAHTHKLQIPRKFWALMIFLVLSIAAVYLSFHFVGKLGKTDSDKMASAGASAPVGQVQGGAQPKHIKTAAEYAADRVPRIDGVPESEPRYDELAVPKTFPRIVACIASTKKCGCFTQQGTPVDIPEFKCRQHVERPQFDPYQEPDLPRRVQDDRQQPRAVVPETERPRQQPSQGLAMDDANPQENRFDQLRHPGLALKRSAGASASSAK